MEDTCRRVREEYVHQCALENARLQDIAAENARLRERLSESETSVGHGSLQLEAVMGLAELEIEKA